MEVFLAVAECSSCNDKNAIQAKWSASPCNPFNQNSTSSG